MSAVRRPSGDPAVSAPPTPRALGYRWPAEWEPHASTWLVWPQARSDWPGRFPAIPWVYAEIVRHLVRGEAVDLVVNDGRTERSAREVLHAAGVRLDRVRFHRFSTDRGWVRDSGPIFVVRRHGPERLAAVRFVFNAWARYDDWHRDARLAERIARARGVPSFRATIRGRPMVLEGGSIDPNGAGALLTTEECLLSRRQARNPGARRDEVEAALSDYLGVDQVIWLGRGLVGDDTHGHVDDIARFVGPTTVVAARAPEESDPNFAPLEENLARLRATRLSDGRRLTVVPLPLPAPRRYAGRPVPASPLNFYFANGRLLVPTFNDPSDRTVLATLASLCPDREVVGIYSGDLIWGLGAIHCATQPEPKA